MKDRYRYCYRVVRGEGVVFGRWRIFAMIFAPSLWSADALCVVSLSCRARDHLSFIKACPARVPHTTTTFTASRTSLQPTSRSADRRRAAERETMRFNAHRNAIRFRIRLPDELE